MLENYKIMLATEHDRESVLALYKANLGGPADWNEYYPNEETIDFDLRRDALFVMKNENEEVIATISIDDDPEVNELECWNKELMPGGELARVCVREDVRNQGIARMLMRHCFEVLKQKGYRSVHILVKLGHVVALQSYSHFDFVQVGECDLFGKHFVCMEKAL